MEFALDSDPFGPVETGLECRTTIARITGFASARKAIDLPGTAVDAIHGVAVAERHIKVATARQGDGARAIEWRFVRARSVRWFATLSIPCPTQS